MEALKYDLKQVIFICKRQVLLLFVCIIIEGCMTYAQPLLLTKITDQGILGKNLTALLSSVLFFVAAKVSVAGMGVLRSYEFVKIHNQMFGRLNEKAFAKLYRIPISMYKEKNGMQILQALQTDIQSLSSIFDEIAALSVGAVFQVIAGAVGLSVISPQMTILLFAMIVAKFIIVVFFSQRKKEVVKENLLMNNQFMAWLEEQISGIREMKLWNLYTFQNNELKKLQKKLLQSYQKSAMWDQKYSFCEVSLDTLIMGFLYLLGGYLVIMGKTTAGSLLAFITYCSNITGSITLLIDVRYYFARIKPSAERFYEFLNGKEEKALFSKKVCYNENDKELIPVIEFCDVTFSYHGQKPVLDGISFQIYQGEKVAIIGNNGVGKSTLFDLITGLYQPDQGIIKIKGRDIRELGLETIRGEIAVVSQNPFFYNTSVIDNIDLGRRNNMEDVVQVCRLSGADSFISQMEEGYETMLGNRGLKLSGGERQKIAVSRALLRKAEIVLLDEATTGYDVDSRKHTMESLFSKQTLVKVTHQEEELRGMDSIYRLHRGKLERIRGGEGK